MAHGQLLTQPRAGNDVLFDNAVERVQGNSELIATASTLATVASPEVDRVGLLRDCISALDLARRSTEDKCSALGYWIRHYKTCDRPFDEMRIAELSALYSVLLQQHRAQLIAMLLNVAARLYKAIGECEDALSRIDWDPRLSLFNAVYSLLPSPVRSWQRSTSPWRRRASADLADAQHKR